MKLLIKLLLLSFSLKALHTFCTTQTAGFTVDQITPTVCSPFHTDIFNQPLDPHIFDQKFHFLAKGGQAFAFVSSDGQYVLKLFKHPYRHTALWEKALRLTGSLGKKKREQITKKRAKFLRDFDSYALAQKELSEESGLLYVHLNQNEKGLPKACIVDRLHICHLISLDKTPFILQKKATLLFPYFSSLIAQGKEYEGKMALDSLISLIQARCAKGIHDDDAKIHRNLGFVNKKAILIDVGRLKKDETRKDSAKQKEDLLFVTQRLKLFLEENSPELATYLQTRLDEL